MSSCQTLALSIHMCISLPQTNWLTQTRQWTNHNCSLLGQQQHSQDMICYEKYYGTEYSSSVRRVPPALACHMSDASTNSGDTDKTT